MTNNQHIRAELRFYLDKTRITHHALMLTGEWGCGKTYFTKEFIKEWRAQHPTPDGSDYNPACYISLDGIKTVDELRKQLFIQLYPLKGKGRKYADRFGISGVSLSMPFIKFDFDPEKLGENFDKLCVRLEDAIFVFDDLERCEIPVRELFGFINQFVEHNEQKVILIANEGKLEEKEKYAEIKEKLVGVTLEVQSSPEAIIGHFIAEMKKGAARDCAEQNRYEILRLFTELKIYNYRSLRTALYDFSRLLSQIEAIFPPFTANTENAREACRRLLILVITTVLVLRANSDKPEKKIKTTLEKFIVAPQLLEHNTLTDFLKKGVLKKEELLKKLENHVLFYQPKDDEMLEWPAFQTALFWCLDKEEFYRLQKRFRHEIENHYIRNIGDIFNLICSLVTYEQEQGKGLEFIKPDIGTYFSTYITELANNNWLNFDKHDLCIENTIDTDDIKQEKNIIKFTDTYKKLKNDKYTNPSLELWSKVLANNGYLNNPEIFRTKKAEELLQTISPKKAAAALFSVKGNIGYSTLYDFLRTYLDKAPNFNETERKWFAKLKTELNALAAQKQPPFKRIAQNIIEQLFSNRY